MHYGFLESPFDRVVIAMLLGDPCSTGRTKASRASASGNGRSADLEQTPTCVTSARRRSCLRGTLRSQGLTSSSRGVVGPLPPH